MSTESSKISLDGVFAHEIDSLMKYDLAIQTDRKGFIYSFLYYLFAIIINTLSGYDFK